MYCMKCGAALNDDSNFCRHCGWQVPAAERDKLLAEGASVSSAGPAVGAGPAVNPSGPSVGAGPAVNPSGPAVGAGPAANPGGTSAGARVDSFASAARQAVRDAASVASQAASSSGESPLDQGLRSAIDGIGEVKVDDPKMSMLFGIGHAVLVALMFLPWASSGLAEFNLVLFVQRCFSNGSASGNGLFYVAGVGAVAVIAAIALSNALGAYLRLAKSTSFNLGFVVTLLAAVVFALLLLVFNTAYSMSSNIPMGLSPAYGFYLTVVLALGMLVIARKFPDLIH